MKKTLIIILFIFLIAILIFYIFINKKFNKKIINSKIENVNLSLRKEGEKKGFHFTKIFLTDENDIQVEFKNYTIYFSDKKSFNSQIISLQKLLKSTKMKSVKEIDFRFDKIILR